MLEFTVKLDNTPFYVGVSVTILYLNHNKLNWNLKSSGTQIGALQLNLHALIIKSRKNTKTAVSLGKTLNAISHLGAKQSTCSGGPA